MKGWENFCYILNGIFGVEICMLILFFEGVMKGWIDLLCFVVFILINYVKIYGFYLKKGIIVVGVDVDIVIWDLDV